MTEADPGNLLWTQFLALLRLSLRRFMRSRYFKGFWVLLFMPVMIGALICGTRLYANLHGGPVFNHSSVIRFSEMLYQGVYIHLAIFFVGVGFGSSVIREELEDQTLHYFFLQPIPKWMLVLAKMGAFLILMGALSILSLATLEALLHIPLGFDGVMEYYFSLEYLRRYLIECAVILIALVVYTSVFLMVSTVFKNVVYAVFFYGWELSSNYLPERMKDFSLAYHFKSLLPHASVDRPTFFGILSEKPGGLQVFLVLATVTLVCLAVSCWMTSRRQCLYGSN